MPGDSRLEYLLGQLKANQLSREEFDELLNVVTKGENEGRVQELWAADIEQTDGAYYDKEYWSQVFRSMLKKEQVPVRRMFPWKWVAAAVVVLIVTGYGLWVTMGRKSEVGSQTEVAKTNDVPAPKDNRAVITLADGRKVYLDSAGNGTIAQENNVNILRNSEGEIQYLSPAGGANGEQRTANSPTYNTLFNPRGSKAISLTLSDGTKVWLNAESSLKYPIAFNDKTREVEITGEAYFEVKHNAKQPFKVHLPNGSIVEDIGTAFNISSYSDENDIKTTLIEGSVRVFANSQQLTANSQILKPGQQAVINPANPSIRRILVQDNVDVNEVMAWKNGRFYFDGADIKTVMRQISRWYDVDVQYDADIKSSFVAKISRDVPVSQLLRIMELTDLVHFKVEGKKITVTK